METELSAAVITHIGLEDVCATEVEGLLGVKTTHSSGLVTFHAPLMKLCELCYLCRSAVRIVIVLGSMKAADPLLGAEQLAQTVPLEGWLSDKTSFACRSSIAGVGQEIAVSAGSILNDRTSAPVNLGNPDITAIVCQSDDTVLLGIDIGGEDLGKRDYRIFLGNDSLRGTIAYGLLSLAGFNGKQTITDIFCRSGVIPIEAALLANGISPHKHERDFPFRKLPQLRDAQWDAFFDDIDARTRAEVKGTIVAMDDSFGAVASAKKNAKIAGVHHLMDFSRTDLQFLDAKFGKGGLDLIVTMPPQPSARLSGKPLEKALEQLFYQAEFILKKKGKVAALTRSNVDLLKQFAAKYALLLVEERKIMQGGLELTALVFTK